MMAFSLSLFCVIFMNWYRIRFFKFWPFWFLLVLSYFQTTILMIRFVCTFFNNSICNVRSSFIHLLICENIIFVSNNIYQVVGPSIYRLKVLIDSGIFSFFHLRHSRRMFLFVQNLLIYLIIAFIIIQIR